MRIDLLTLFPDMCETVTTENIVGRARKKGALQVCHHRIRNYTYDRHSRVDDCPFGDEIEILLMAEPIAECIDGLAHHFGKKPHLVYMSPQGTVLTQKKMKGLAEHENLATLCGHYEGIDERIIDCYVDEQISAGDYVLIGGELLAPILADGISRLIPDVFSDDSCFEEESHFSGLLEYPQHTRPANWRGLQMPKVLLSGRHASIDKWRREQSLLRTWKNRPDLFETTDLDEKDRRYLAALCEKERGPSASESGQNAQYRIFAAEILEGIKVFNNRGKLYKGIVYPKQRIGYQSKISLLSLTAFSTVI